MSISAAEFEALQLQLIELKEAKYESQDREKKLLNEIKTLKEHAASLENDLKKAEPSPSKTFSLSGVMSKSKDKKEIAALMSENESLQRNMELAAQEHKEQQDATMQNMKNLYAANKTLEEEIENLKKTALEKDRKIEQQEGQLRKLQIQLIQYETSADIHKGSEQSQENHKDNEGDETEKSDQSAQEENTNATENSGKFEDENNRLRENVRLLSTQLKALDEQLSTSEASYRSQLASLEQQVSTYKEKIKQDEIASAHMEARLEEELAKTLKSKEELVTRLVDVEEQGKREKSQLEEQSKRDKTQLDEQTKREKGLVDQLDELRGQLGNMSGKFDSTKSARDEYMEQVKKVTAECESVSQAKIALESKLHELEAEAELLRKVRDEHSTTLTELDSAKNKIKNLEISLDRANLECAELVAVKKELERVQQSLEAATTQAVSLQAELDALKTEAEQLRTDNSKLVPLEAELEGLKLAHLQAVTASQTFKEQYEEERLKLTEAESKVTEAKSKLAEVSEQVEGLTAQISKLNTEKEDLITEYKVEERKSQRMIKELKAEIQKERTSLSRSVSIEQLPIVPPSPIANSTRHSPPMSPVPLTPPVHTRLTKQQSEAVNALPLLSASVGNMELSATTKEELLRRDLETSLTQFGKMAEDKWKLEEKTRFLEENLALLNEDLVRKTKVIQYYVGKTKQTVTNEQLAERDKARKQSGVRGALLRAGGNDQEFSMELLTKMEAVLEETLLKNIQLQNDLVTIGNETGVLQKEIRQLKDDNKQLADESMHYKGQLMRIMSGPNA